MAYFTDQMKEEFRKALEGSSSSSKENEESQNKIDAKKKRKTRSSKVQRQAKAWGKSKS